MPIFTDVVTLGNGLAIDSIVTAPVMPQGIVSNYNPFNIAKYTLLLFTPNPNGSELHSLVFIPQNQYNKVYYIGNKSSTTHLKIVNNGSGAPLYKYQIGKTISIPPGMAAQFRYDVANHCHSLLDVVNSAITLDTGSASDGDLFFDGTSTVMGIAPVNFGYTLTRDVYANNLTVRAEVGFNTNDFKIFCKGTFLNQSTKFTNVGTAGKNGSSNGTGGEGGSKPSLGTLIRGQNGGRGNNGDVDGNGVQSESLPSIRTLIKTLGGFGGRSGKGVVRLSGAQRDAQTNIYTPIQNVNYNLNLANTDYNVYPPAPGGGGQGGASGGGYTLIKGAGGGGGGESGGIIMIIANIYQNNGTISVKGGAGGQGGNAINGAGAGGGGGGGTGGFIAIYVNNILSEGAYNIDGGIGGKGGQLQSGGGQAGSPGGKGEKGQVIIYESITDKYKII